MKIDLDKIEATAALAQKRRPGPWKRYRFGHGVVFLGNANSRVDCIVDSSPKPDGFDGYDGGEWRGETVLETDGGYYEPKGVTAEHIANCSPDVVLELVRRIRRLRQLAWDFRLAYEESHIDSIEREMDELAGPQ